MCMLQNQLENFLSKQLLNPEVTHYLNELAQLNAKKSIQLQQAYTKINQLEKSLRLSTQKIDLSAKIVTDTKNKLMWAVNANQKDNFPNPNKSISWYEIKSWITSVNEKGYGGFKDWRLPTKDELSTLLLAKPVNQCWLDKNLFFDTQWKDKLIYWTSSTQSIVGLSKPHVYLVNFNLGFCYTGTPQNTYQLRLVRSI